MSKAEGQKIAIKFTEPINELEMTVITEVDEEYTLPTGIVTQSDYYNYPGSKAFDGSTSTYWYNINAMPQWVMIQMKTAKPIAGFRLYTYEYPPSGIDLYGSNDGVNFDLITQVTVLNSTGWQEYTFSATDAYKYYKWIVTGKHSVYMRIYELELLYLSIKEVSGNEDAFTITGQEYEAIDTPHMANELISKTYAVSAVQTHPTEPNSILLDVEGFRNVKGDIIINYNQALGNLSGSGGAVKTFTETFTPTDLEQGLTIFGGAIGTHENIQASISGSITMELIEKIPTHNKEYISASVDGTIDFIHIDDLNP